MTMTTNNTDEEEKIAQNRETATTGVAALDITQGLIKRRANSSCDSSIKGLDLRMKQIDKHVSRMSMSKLKKEYDRKLREVHPGSGLLWQNKITVPITPNITGIQGSQGWNVRRAKSQISFSNINHSSNRSFDNSKDLSNGNQEIKAL
jgi:hypothetical protein